MEGIDLLQNLTEQRKVLFEAVKAQEKALNEKLFTFFKTISEYDGLEMMPLQCDITTPWRKQGAFEVYLNIKYYNEKGETWEDGSIKADFGSGIDLYIFEDHIEMNYGTCGTYSKTDKGQMSRAMFIPKLWENEDTICSIAKETINMNDYDELQQISRQIDRINDDIKTAQRERERKEILQKIRRAKFICKRRKQEINGRWDEEKREYVNDGYEYVYHSFEEIKKVTDSNVLTVDEYYHDNHRRNLSQIISDVRGGYLFLQDEKIDKEPIPEEVPAKQAGAPTPPKSGYKLLRTIIIQ